MKITTNNQPRDIISWYDLTEKEQKEFDYINTENQIDALFFRYKGNVYDIGEAVYITSMGDWEGIYSQSYFHGVLIKIDPYMESVIVGQYFS